jgi:hypothetical protein
MNEQKLAAVKQAIEALQDFADVIKYDNEQDDIGSRACCGVLSYNQHSENCKAAKSITALQSIISQDALDKKAAQPAVQDADGENKAVRSFLMLYGQPGLTVGQMKKHMTISGFKAWPTWVETEPHGAHLTKAGAQLWIRHLFALEPTTPQPVPVKTYHDGKPWPVAPKPWVGLTEQEAAECWSTSTVRTWQAIEAKLKEKNNG